MVIEYGLKNNYRIECKYFFNKKNAKYFANVKNYTIYLFTRG
jgi:hypothetical protein